MGLGITEGGALAATPDYGGIGAATWAEMSGMRPGDPLMGGGPAGNAGVGRFDVDARYASVHSTSAEPAPPAAGADVFDDWRDLVDFRNSPAPYVLLLAFAMFGFMQLRVNARLGPGKANVAIG